MNNKIKDFLAWVAAFTLAIISGVGVLATGLLIAIFFDLLP